MVKGKVALWRRPLAMAFASASTALVVMAASAPAAMADLKLCNRTDSKVGVALGYKDIQQGWTSEGWWNVAPSNCVKLKEGPLNARYYYVYASISTRAAPGAAHRTCAHRTSCSPSAASTAARSAASTARASSRSTPARRWTGRWSFPAPRRRSDNASGGAPGRSGGRPFETQAQRENRRHARAGVLRTRDDRAAVRGRRRHVPGEHEPLQPRDARALSGHRAQPRSAARPAHRRPRRPPGPNCASAPSRRKR